MIMDTIFITVTKSARLLWVEINLFGEIVEKVINRGPGEMQKIEKLLIQLLEEKGFENHVIHAIEELAENRYAYVVGKRAS